MTKKIVILRKNKGLKNCCQPFTSLIIFCAIYIDKNFVHVDGTIMIKPMSGYTSNGIDIIEIKIRRK